MCKTFNVIHEKQKEATEYWKIFIDNNFPDSFQRDKRF